MTFYPYFRAKQREKSGSNSGTNDPEPLYSQKYCYDADFGPVLLVISLLLSTNGLSIQAEDRNTKSKAAPKRGAAF